MASRVEDIDRGWRLILRNITRMAPGPNVTVGIQGSEATEQHGGLTNARLGVIHEFGSRDGHIPQRSFLRGTIDRTRGTVNKMLTRAAMKTAGGANLERELDLVGLKVVTEVKRTFNNSIGLKAIKQATIDRKGSSKPLVDVGTLRDSVTWKVHKR